MSMQIRVGCCGLAGLSLARYAEMFDTAEINSTFYRLPNRETAERWFERTGGKVVFCMKAFQGITHPISSPTWKRAGRQIPKSGVKNYGHLKPTAENVVAWERTLEICEAIHAHVCVIQMPPSFTCTDRSVRGVLEFSRIVRRPVEIALEFRHGSWLENIGVTRSLIDGAGLIHITDPLKEKPESGKKICYYRLHGLDKHLYRYNYTDEDLCKLKGTVLNIKCQTAYVMFNNLSMRDDALRFKKMIE